MTTHYLCSNPGCNCPNQPNTDFCCRACALMEETIRPMGPCECGHAHCRSHMDASDPNGETSAAALPLLYSSLPDAADPPRENTPPSSTFHSRTSTEDAEAPHLDYPVGSPRTGWQSQGNAADCPDSLQSSHLLCRVSHTSNPLPEPVNCLLSAVSSAGGNSAPDTCASGAKTSWDALSRIRQASHPVCQVENIIACPIEDRS